MDRYLESFIAYLSKIKHYSNYTIIGYEANIDMFLQFLDEYKIKDLNKVDDVLIRKYLAELYHHQYAKKTISRHISSLRSFFKYLLKEDVIKNNPMVLISNPKLDKTLPHFLTEIETEDVLKKPDQTKPLGLRDALILELMYSTGIRVSELVSIKLKDVDHSLRQISILGKGNKERLVVYGGICEKLMDKYLNESRACLLGKKTSEYLLLNIRGSNLTTRMIRDIVNKYAQDLKEHISPHVFRHTFATHMLNEGADLKTVQELLGHENLSTTQVYTHVSNERLRRVYLEAHPRAKEK